MSNISKAAKAIAKGSGTLVKTTKLTLKLSSEEGKLKDIYIEIGKAVAEIYKGGGGLGGPFDAKFQQILEAEVAITEVKARLDAVKGLFACPKCSASLKGDLQFCPKCGVSLEFVEVDEIDGAEVLRVEPAMTSLEDKTPREGKICSICGSNNSDNDKFCLSCGRVL